MLLIKNTTYILGLVFAFALTGCASSVMINSDPQGASVTVDGQYLGEAPVTYTDTAIVFSTRNVVLEMQGYETVRTTFSRSDEVNVPALVGGLLCLWPLLLWAMDYPRSVEYRMPSHRVEAEGQHEQWSVVYP